MTPAKAQSNLDGRFTFVMPWDDASKGTVTDLSALNAKPAGVNGRIAVRNGHFVESGTGKRIRFFGMNFSGKNNFPTHGEADKIAAHLAKLGFNVLRVHHADGNSSPLWDKNVPGFHTFSAESIDRLDYLVAALKKQGIYINLNLHVSRTFSPADGFPDSVRQLPGSFNKRIDNFDRRMIALQKEFARNLLTHVNPYTRLSYTTDPAVAFVEINNENSLTSWESSQLRFDFFEKLPEPFRGELISLWNQWLVQKYGTDDALRAAWGASELKAAVPVEPVAQAQWVLQNVENTASVENEVGAATPLGNIKVINRQATKEDWHVQAQILPLDLESGRSYVVSFRARADRNRVLPLYASVQNGDWHNVGLKAEAGLTTEWKGFSFSFDAQKTEANNNRIAFVMGKEAGTVWLSDVKVTPGAVLPALQSLREKSVAIPTGGTSQARADWIRFLVETERSYTDEMLGYLRRDLKVQANLVNSQMAYGELASFYREANSQFTDEHAYWQHPEFPTEKWDSGNWKMKQRSMVDALAKGDDNALVRLALHRVAGKPYTVSEYCVPAPSYFQAEMYPIIASYAALQDWDAIYHFDFGDYGEAVPSNRIQGFFSLNGNPLKESFAAAAALLFRQSGMAPLQGVSTLAMSQNSSLAGKKIGLEWTTANGGRNMNLLNSRFQVQPGLGAAASRLVQTQSGNANSSARVVQLKSGAVYVAQGSGALTVAGYVGGDTLKTPDATLQFPAFGTNYMALILTSAVGKTLRDSERLLLSIGGQAENTDMGWNADRSSVGSRWGNAPTMVEGIPATVTLNNRRVRRVWALDATGARVREVPVQRVGDSVTFVIGPEFKTLNYEVGV